MPRSKTLVLCAVAAMTFALSPWLLSAPARAEKLAAFVVGIDKYQSGWRSLDVPGRNAARVSATLRRQGFTVTNPTVPGGSLTWSQFIEHWRAFRESIDQKTKVVIYLIGHGVARSGGESHFLPSDVESVRYRAQALFWSTTISIRALVEDVQRKTLQPVLLIVDACRINPLIPPEHQGPHMGFSSRGLAKPITKRGLVMVQSASPNELAWEYLPGEKATDVDTTAFGRHMLKALANGSADFLAAVKQVQKKTSQSTTGLTGSWEPQNPIVASNISGVFCLTKCSPEVLRSHQMAGLTPARKALIAANELGSLTALREWRKVYGRDHPFLDQLAKQQIASLNRLDERERKQAKPKATDDARKRAIQEDEKKRRQEEAAAKAKAAQEKLQKRDRLARAAQRELIRIGCYRGSPDGKFLTRSKNAWKRATGRDFGNRDLTEDDIATLRRLGRDTCKRPTKVVAPTPVRPRKPQYATPRSTPGFKTCGNIGNVRSC